MRKPRPDLVRAMLWDVDWDEGGVGKHGSGPFATERQAQACLRVHGYPGTVRLLKCWVEPRRLAMIEARGLRRDLRPARSAV